MTEITPVCTSRTENLMGRKALCLVKQPVFSGIMRATILSTLHRFSTCTDDNCQLSCVTRYDLHEFVHFESMRLFTFLALYLRTENFLTSAVVIYLQ
jgi:hypothetical protein